MSDELFISEVICERLAAGSPVVLVSIIDSSGSSPRRSGSKMVVCADGSVFGTIGGGLLEAEATERCSSIIAEGRPWVTDFGFRGTSTNSDEMLCGGSAKLLFDLLLPIPDTIQFFAEYNYLVKNGENFFALTAVKAESDGISIIGRSLYTPNGVVTGDSPWEDHQFEALKSELRQVSSAELIALGDLNIVADPVRKTKTLYLFGGGHVAMATAHLASMVGFSVVVLDDRDDYANLERFPDAEKALVVSDFANACDGLSVDADSFLVIVTRGHRHDKIVLEQALKTKAGYIGMIGSKRKREIIFSELRALGVSPEQLNKVHCPIGISIEAETPEEIGISIVAELIQARARLMG